MLFDRSNGRTYIGSFEPTYTQTAHEQLAHKAGVDPSNCVGGSIQRDGDGGWQMGQRSESLNQKNLGKCEAHGNTLRPAREDLGSGSYYTVSSQGSVNKGTKSWW